MTDYCFAAPAPASIPTYGIKSTSSVKAADGVVPVVTAVPPVEPEVVVTLYCTPFTKIAAFLSDQFQFLNDKVCLLLQ